MGVSMMRSFAIFAFLSTVILARKGAMIRKYSFASLGHWDEGANVVDGLAEEGSRSGALEVALRKAVTSLADERLQDQQPA